MSHDAPPPPLRRRGTSVPVQFANNSTSIDRSSHWSGETDDEDDEDDEDPLRSAQKSLERAYGDDGRKLAAKPEPVDDNDGGGKLAALPSKQEVQSYAKERKRAYERNCEADTANSNDSHITWLESAQKRRCIKYDEDGEDGEDERETQASYFAPPRYVNFRFTPTGPMPCLSLSN